MLTDAQKIQAVANARHHWEYLPAYSGRGMFGRTCPAIVCPPESTKTARRAVFNAGVTATPSEDSMGLDTILYWPAVTTDTRPETDDDGAPETGLTPRELDRARSLAAMVYDMAFGLIDAQVDLDGNDAGAIATAVEQAFLRAYARRLNGPFDLA